VRNRIIQHHNALGGAVMNNATKVKRIPVCPRCGSDNVAADAAARWNRERQEWEVSNVFDKGHGCDDCGAENIEFAWVDDQSETAIATVRALDDIDVREEETDVAVIDGGRIEWATFVEGEYVESILVERARASAIYRDLGKTLGVTSRTVEALRKAEVLIAADIIRDDAGYLAEIRAILAETTAS
jgi:transcription elongation factor Elf1